MNLYLAANLGDRGAQWLSGRVLDSDQTLHYVASALRGLHCLSIPFI